MLRQQDSILESDISQRGTHKMMKTYNTRMLYEGNLDQEQQVRNCDEAQNSHEVNE